MMASTLTHTSLWHNNEHFMCMIEYMIEIREMKINDFQFCSYLAVFSCWPGAQFYPPAPKKWPRLKKRKQTWKITWRFLLGLQNLSHLDFSSKRLN